MMIDMGLVRGDKEQAVPLIVGKSKVYIHTEITEIFDPQGNITGYEYREIQYDKDEYIQLMAEQKDELDAMVIDQEYRIILLELGGEI